MPSLLASTANTRQVLPGSFRFLRSDALTQPTPQDVAFLQGCGITRLIDLRTAAERERRPCPLAGHDAFQYLPMPVTGGSALPASAAEVAASYIRMVDEQMTRILQAISGAEGGALFFCTAGKDRTGVVSALLQRRAGLSRAAIVADYLLSGANLGARLRDFADLHPEIDPAIFTPCASYMEAFLDWLDGRII